LKPLTPIQASSTIVNLVLATGPFSYPQGFVQLGPVMSLTLITITCFISYMTATFMIEAVSVAHAEDNDRRRDSMFGELSYVSPIVQQRRNKKDSEQKDSPFYIRKKIEMSIVADRVAR
jgi:hypothetical protein